MQPRSSSRRDDRVLRWALVGIFVILFFHALSYARAFLLPVILAWLLSFMFRPVTRAFVKLSMPKPIAAALVVACVLVLLSSALVGLYRPAMNWVANAPKSLQKVEYKVRRFLEPAAQMSQAMQEVEKMTTVQDNDTTPTTRVEVKDVTLAELVFNWTRSAAVGALVTFGLLFFFLASGDSLVRGLVRVVPRAQDKQAVVEVARQTEEQISTYLFTIAVINACVGTLVGLAMYFLGLPNPALWGVMAGFLKFIPYIGELFSLTVIALVSFLQFDNLGQAILPPALFIAITSAEANFVTPYILGRRLTLGPVFIFTSLIFWGWLWGVPGAIISVPLLMTFKIVCEQVPSLNPVGEFLGR